MARKEDKLFQDWLKLCDHIKQSTPIDVEDGDRQKERIQQLKGDWERFCKYYFPHYLTADFGWFHKAAAKEIIADPEIFASLEWPREHAKSVFGMMMTMFLYANGELKGLILVSLNETKANKLLSDVQAEFVSNQRWINDYGDLAKFGSWKDGMFSTTDGIGFSAYGRGQSPRGTREGANRPNLLWIDDIDDKITCRNPKRVKEYVEYLMEDCYGALSLDGGRIMAMNNRIHPQSIFAHLVGDINPETPKREGIYHSKVFAFEHIRTHTKGEPGTKGVRPAWHERFRTGQKIINKMKKMGRIAARREYFHEHHEDGLVFNEGMWQYCKVPKDLKKYDSIISYCDPSWKETKKNDYKAIITIGTIGTKIYIMDVWLKQTTTLRMVQKFYDLFEHYGNYARYYMEASFMQDIILDEFTTEGKVRGYQMPIRGDKRSKPNKEQRIENMSVLFERGFIWFNEELIKHPDFVIFLSQLIGFPFAKDDGPDALEGGIYYVQRGARSRGSSKRNRTGKYNRSSKRD